MSSPVEIIHASVPGRARFHIPALRHSDALKHWLESELIGSAGIERASASPITGNVLVYFNPAVGPQIVEALLGEIIGKFSFSSSPRLESPSETWHQLSSAEALTALEAHPGGLSVDEIADRLRQYGRNTLPGMEPPSALATFVDQFRSLPVALLVGGAALSFLTAGPAEAFVILGVVGLNAVTGFILERRAETTIQSLRSLARPPAWVVRDGEVRSVDAEQVVPGDILVLKRGNLVPADGRIIEAERLRLNEATLTGESMPVPKHAEVLPGEETLVADRLNMVYRGTWVSGGRGLAVAVATGKATELGRIHGLVLQAEAQATPLERTMDRLARQLAVITGCVCGLSFLIGFLRGYGLLEILKTSLSLAAAAIPEGLPTITTTTLAVGIQNMRRHRVMIHRLEAVEALGSIQTLCFDKTGTITENQVTVIAIHAGMRRINRSDDGFTVDGIPVNPVEYEELVRLMQIGALCSDTDVRRDHGEWVLNGPPMDNALVNLAIRGGVDVLELRRDHPIVAVRRGSTNRKYMMSIHASEGSGANGVGLVTVKGRPAAVLARCGWQIKEGRKLPLGGEDRREIGIETDRLAAHAMRVVGLAYREVDSPKNLPESDPSDLTWLGTVGFADPIRAGAKDLITAFHEAGIATVMITGDRVDTAFSIGKELGLAERGQFEILDSTHLRNLEPEVLSGLTERVHVFARLSPSEKRRIVLALQRRGKVVAMTGDGINDTPALKAADIGIAMGKSGTALAREVADVILEDDRLETMIIAVRQGRTLYNNIRKSTRYLLAATVGEVIVRFAGIALNLSMPTPFVWVNPIFPAVALALEPPEPDVLKRPPRPSHQPIIGPDDLKRIAFEGGMMSVGALGAYGYGLARYGPGTHAGTLAFMGLSTAQILHALSCRTERHTLFREAGMKGQSPLPPNPYLWVSIGGTLLLQGVGLLVPGVRTFLGLTSISLLDGAVIGASGVLPLLINDATKGPIPKLSASPEAMITDPAFVTTTR